MNRLRPICVIVASLWVSTAQPATSEAQESLQGQYSAVTESEWDIELEIGAGGLATYTHVFWEAGKSATATRNAVEARWELKEEHLTLTFTESESVKTVVYRIIPCLSYETFGGKGCSAGLSPVSNEMSGSYWQPLWNAESFESL
jgi:hypothetical protein